MALSGKSHNAFLFRMQKIHIKTSSKKCLLCHKCIVLYTLYLKFFTYSVIFCLHKNIGNLLYDPCLLFKLPSRVQEMHHRQACRQHGEMESKLDHESAGLGWNPQAGHFTSLDFHFLLQGHQGLSGFFSYLEDHEEHKASGFSWNSICTSTRHFGPSAFSLNQLSRYLSSPWVQETSEMGLHLRHRKSNNGGCLPIGGNTWTEGLLST